MKNIAVILAGGTGSRVGGKTPKQFLSLADGRTVFEHAVEAFEAAPCIDEILVVMHPNFLDEARRLCERNAWRKLTQIIPGGDERWESSWHAIKSVQNSAFSIQNSEVSLWLHDAARPFVSQRILADVAKALESHEAVTVAVPVTDTLYKVKSERLKVKGESEVESIPARTEFMRAQTPQAFHLTTIAEAYQRALEAGNVAATDDAGIVRKYMPDTPIYIVLGEETNKKITYKSDLV